MPAVKRFGVLPAVSVTAAKVGADTVTLTPAPVPVVKAGAAPQWSTGEVGFFDRVAGFVKKNPLLLLGGLLVVGLLLQRRK